VRILIVDDSRAMRAIIMRTLRQAGLGGHDLVEASNGVEALSACRSSSPDLVLSDWNMPEMNGMELLLALRRMGSPVKFGFVTSEGSPEMRRTAAEAGALFLIAKPFTTDAFRFALERAMP